MKTEILSFSKADILAILPHRPPFLFVDKVIKLIPDKMIVTERELLPDEPHFVGHFPGKPIMPGVLITDGLAQTSGLLWGLSKKVNTDDKQSIPEVFFLAAANMKYTHTAEPGDILRMTATKDSSFGAFHSYTVEASAGRHLVAKGTLTLAMKETAL
jgi:3-hydroxyacyl-[acyl-carrier-protein] dehydratase